MADIRKPLNSFNMTVVAGQIAEISAAGPESQTVMIVDDSTDTVLPAYPVKLVPGASSVPLVDLAVPGTDPIYGIALFNPKYSSWVAKDILQVTCRDAVIYMISDDDFDRGTKVGLDPTTYKLIAATPTNYIGDLLDDAVGDEIARVEIRVPAGTAPTS